MSDVTAVDPRRGTRVPHQPRTRRLTVIRVEPLGSRMSRIVLGGPDLEPDFPMLPMAPADHVKLIFPDAETGDLVLPQPGGLRSPRADGTFFEARDYTVRAFDAVAGELSLDFVLHDHGPAGRWAIAAAPGTQLGVLGPRGSHVFPTGFARYLLIVDETGLPALERFIEELPSSAPVTAVVQVDYESHERPLASRPNVSVRWVHSGAGQTVDAAVRELVAASDPDLFVWAAGETGALKPVRAYLVHELGIQREQLDLHGYWKRGAAGNIGHGALED